MTKKEQTKQHILATAWQLFSENGYESTSTRDIAKAAGVANGTVFSHFPTKIAILKHSFEKELDEVLEQAALSDNSKTASDRMCHYAKFLFQFYLNKKEFSRELLKEIIWQHNELATQLMIFKRQLINNTKASKIDADVIVDIYFMTLVEGLNTNQSSVDSMLISLKTKLERLNIA